jgi:rare lipoprotein A
MKRLLLIPFIFFPLISYAETATYYHDWFNGKIMSNGQVYRNYRNTCASMFHRMGTRLKVTNLVNKKSVIVTVTDRGNFSHRNVDLSKSAFMRIGKLSQGRLNVKIEILK